MNVVTIWLTVFLDIRPLSEIFDNARGRPDYTIEVRRAAGLLIALGGFILSTSAVVLPSHII